MISSITTPEMEIALSRHFNYRQNLIVPNVSWGMAFITDYGWHPLHECDLLICTNSGYLWECEIKVSKPDLIKDKKKTHGHFHPAIRRLYFGIPENLQYETEHIPETAGIVVVRRGKHGLVCDEIRRPRQGKGYKLSDSQKLKMAKLGCMRVWNLKKRIVKQAIL